MATQVDIAGTNITAPQMGEFFRLAALPNGRVNRKTFQAYLEGRNPFALERNGHGHVVLTFTGLDLMGAEEIERLGAARYNVREDAKSCFLSTREDGYDKHHRLVVGRVYKVALMPDREIERGADRTTANLQRRGMEYYGYGKSVAGFIPRVREILSDQLLEEICIWHVTALHDPITGSDGVSRVLSANRNPGGRRVDAYWGRPDRRWDGRGAFVFPVTGE